MPRTTSIGGLVGHLILRPRLYGAAVRAAWRFRRRGWYRVPPFLPLPSPEYLDWRLHTAYGEEGAGPSAHEFERYLRWMDRMQRSRRKD